MEAIHESDRLQAKLSNGRACSTAGMCSYESNPVCWFLAAGRASPSTAAYLELLGALPGMHAASLKLLQVLLQAGGGALAPLHRGITRLMADLLRRLATDPPTFLATSSWLVRREVPACTLHPLLLISHCRSAGGVPRHSAQTLSRLTVVTPLLDAFCHLRQLSDLQMFRWLSMCGKKRGHG